MKTYTTDQLKEILKLHQLWVQSKEGGVSAILSGANLRNPILRNCNLSGAILRNCDLSYADLSGVNLSGAILSNCNLRNCILSGAILSGADLSNADLRNAILSNCNLRNCILSGAILSGADLSSANLRGANFRGAIGLPIADDAPFRLLAVAKAALSSPDALEMGAWRTCATTHCLCGWAEHLGGSLAKLIIKQFGYDMGGLMLLGVEAHSYFYSTNCQAREFLQSVIDNAEVRL